MFPEGLFVVGQGISPATILFQRLTFCQQAADNLGCSRTCVVNVAQVAELGSDVDADR